MSPENTPTQTNEDTITPLEKGQPILVENEQGGIDVMTAAGQKYSGDRELVGIQASPEDLAMSNTTLVEASELLPVVQEQLARDLSEKPLIGDRVLAKINGKIVEAKVVGGEQRPSGRYVITVEAEDGSTEIADPRAFSPEIQARMEADRQKQVAEEVGDVALEASDVDEPNIYDKLLNPNYKGAIVQEAAVKPVETEEEKSLRELREYHQKVALNAQIQTAADDYRERNRR